MKPDHVLDRLMEKLDLTGLVGSPPAECLPPSGKSFVQILLMFEVQRLFVMDRNLLTIFHVAFNSVNAINK